MMKCSSPSKSTCVPETNFISDLVSETSERQAPMVKFDFPRSGGLVADRRRTPGGLEVGERDGPDR